MADGPNHELNFERGILTAQSNLNEITAYLRFNKNSGRYQDFLEMYLPKLEGTEVYDEFLKDYKAIKADNKTYHVEKEVKNEVVEEELTEEAFRELSAKEQRKLVDAKLEGQEREDGDDSNADKRVSLYFS